MEILSDLTGKPIVLNEMESLLAQNMQRKIMNDLGYNIDITMLTTVIKKVTEQKFFSVRPSEYLPVRVGEGAWSSQLTTFRSFDIAGDFETGLLNTGADNARMAQADAGVDALSIQVFNWAKSINWTIMDLFQAAKAGNWDLVTAKERSRKRNWDLGIQRIAFLGADGMNGPNGKCKGLLNQTNIEINSTLIGVPLKEMTPAQLKVFLAEIIGLYRAQNNYTAMPTHFIIPEDDYLGLASQSSPQFPLKSTLTLLLEAFQAVTRNAQFQILPLAYAQIGRGMVDANRYTLLNYDEESVRMDIPVDYTATLANSLDNFNFQNAAYGQFTGVGVYRPLELMYFDHTPVP